MSTVKDICKGKDYFARGNIKKAYNVKMCDAGTEPEFTSDIEITQLCIVFMKEIKWMIPPAEYGPQFIPFKTKVITDPEFRYNIHKLIDRHKTDNPDWETKEPKIPITDPDHYLEEFSEIKNLNRLIDWFEQNNQQFDYINELKKLNELGKLGLAPILYQIRINNDPPFLPDEIDEKITVIPDKKDVEISYLMEKCGMNIAEFIQQNSSDYKNEKLAESAIEHICKFSDAYVKITKSVNCDLKYENLCPIIVDGEIISIRLLDVDPIYSVEEKGNPDFERHAKVFMKFFIFAYLFKKTKNKLLLYWFFKKKKCVFDNVEVHEMIVFFYGMDYMIYEFNPINMMYNYLIKTHPLVIKKEKDEGPKYKYEILHFDNLKPYFTDEEIIAVFQDSIRLVPPPVAALAKGGKKRKTRKSKKSRKSRKSKKSRK